MDEDKGIKGYNLIMTEIGGTDKAFTEISKTIRLFWNIEDIAFKVEPVLTIKDSLKIIGKKE